MSETDRMTIQALLQFKLSGLAIAQQLSFSRSTIYREINRWKATPTALAGADQACFAQVRSCAGCTGAGLARHKLGSDMDWPLWRTVLNRLRCYWSPQQIAGKLPSVIKVVAAAGRFLVGLAKFTFA